MDPNLSTEYTGFLFPFSSPEAEVFVTFDLWIPQETLDFLEMAGAFGWRADPFAVSRSGGSPSVSSYFGSLEIRGLDASADFEQAFVGGGSIVSTAGLGDTWIPVAVHIGHDGAHGDPWSVNGTQNATTPDSGGFDMTYVVFGLLNNVSTTDADWGSPVPNHGAMDLCFRNIKIGTTLGGTELHDGTAETDLSAYTVQEDAHGTVSYETGATSSFGDDATTDGGAGGVRIAVAFDDTTFEPDPTWTFLTALAAVRAASYSLDKGKQDEQDQVGTTQVVVNVFDRDGTLDPTNSSGPYYGLIDTLLQIRIELYNPVTGTWHSRFRGFIRDWDYVPYPGSHVDPEGVVEGYYSVQISAVGIMEPITAIELQIGAFGDTPPAGTEGNVFFDNATFQDRISQVWGNAGIPDDWLVAFTGNVEMAESRYSPTDNVMSVIQDAVDAELPTVANAYEDRFGRLACHGRLAELDPVGTFESTTPDRWDFTEWKAGDERAVLASPSDTAQIREAPFNRGNGHLINSGYCTPAGIAEADKAGQLYVDTASVGVKGIRSWSKENLYISEGLLTGNTANEETFLYAKFAVENGKEPKNRFTRLTFKSMHPNDGRAAPNWDLLTRCDVQDSIAVTITFAGRPADSPNFNLEPFFILGIHEQVTPLTDAYAMVATSLDVAPRPLDPVGLATPG